MNPPFTDRNPPRLPLFEEALDCSHASSHGGAMIIGAIHGGRDFRNPALAALVFMALALGGCASGDISNRDDYIRYPYSDVDRQVGIRAAIIRQTNPGHSKEAAYSQARAEHAREYHRAKRRFDALAEEATLRSRLERDGR